MTIYTSASTCNRGIFYYYYAFINISSDIICRKSWSNKRKELFETFKCPGDFALSPKEPFSHKLFSCMRLISMSEDDLAKVNISSNHVPFISIELERIVFRDLKWFVTTIYKAFSQEHPEFESLQISSSPIVKCAYEIVKLEKEMAEVITENLNNAWMKVLMA
jgi:hypothetical protein